jgi:hypothetical protein
MWKILFAGFLLSTSPEMLYEHSHSAQYGTLQSKNGWRKVNICWFGLGKWLFSCIFAEAGKKGQQSCAPAREECNKYDLIAAPCFWLANPNDHWSRWFAISSSHYFRSLFQSYGWGCKKVNNQTWMWEIFLQDHILGTCGDALRLTVWKLGLLFTFLQVF